MTEHHATPEDWDLTTSEAADCSATHACILELRARVEALEATQHVHALTSRLSDEERRTAVEGLSKPGRWQPLRTEITYGEANAHAQGLVRHLSMDQPAPSPAVGRVRDLQDQVRDGSLTLKETLMELAGTTPAPAPADSLVERVEAAIDEADTETGCQARAAIREVAAWMRSELNSTNTADRLEQQADR